MKTVILLLLYVMRLVENVTFIETYLTLDKVYKLPVHFAI